MELKLQKVIPWSIKGDVLRARFGENARIKCGENEPVIVAADGTYGSNCAITSFDVAIQIPPLTQMGDTPPPTSSTTMREMIYYYVINNRVQKYFDYIKKIMFGPDNVMTTLHNKDDLITATINEHLVMYNNEYTNTKTKYDAITADYTARNDAIYTQIGGNKHTKKKHRKSNKKRKSNKRR